jgi:type II secretory pathway component PulC
MLANINQILTEAKAVQITNPDGTLAYKMTEVIPGSIYSQLNIQENDIITHINGKKIENLNELMSLLGRIKEIDQFQLTLKRNGMNENLEYNFE